MKSKNTVVFLCRDFLKILSRQIVYLIFTGGCIKEKNHKQAQLGHGMAKVGNIDI